MKPEVTTRSTRRLALKRQSYRGHYFSELLGQGISLDMMLIPGGTFLMGSPEDEIGHDSSEEQHEVTVPPVFMSRTLITQAQWKIIAEPLSLSKKGRKFELIRDPSHFKGANRPVEKVSWLNAKKFCERLSLLSGRTYRLPTEAEWEYACRARTSTPFHYGETLGDELANYRATETFGRGVTGKYRWKTTNVGIFQPNSFGLYDMHGNVWEWCEDDWHQSYKAAPKDGSAWIDEDNTKLSKVLRGGSWFNGPGLCRSACRFSNHRIEINNDIGFRVCCVPPRIFFSP